MRKIFISYRRDDAASAAVRVYDQLAGQFGSEAVLKGEDSIPAGVPFPDYIEGVMRASAVALVVIGPRWLTAGPAWRRLLDDPRDSVRIEVETALRLGVAVIPLLVEGATMPPAPRLPASLRPLTQRNALPVRPDPDFHRDMERLLAAMNALLAAADAAPPAAAEPATSPGATPGVAPVADARSAPVTQPRVRATSAPVTPWPETAPGATPPRGNTPFPAPPATPVNPVTPAAGAGSRNRVASRGALYGALALLLVALLAVAPFTLPKLSASLFPLTPAQKTAMAATRETGAEQTALASFTPIFYQSPTPSPTPVIFPITAGYTTASPGCDGQRWDPHGATPQCSTSAMTLTHASADDAITATVSGAPATYTVDVTISNLQGAAWGVININDLLVGVAPYPGQTYCQLAEPWNSSNGLSANIATAASYHFHIVIGAYTGRTGNVTITVNGANCWYPDEGGAPLTFAPGPLRTLSLTLYDQYGGANPTASDAVTFSNFTLTSP